MATAFDITEKLRYGDVLAAGAAILQRSGAGEARVRLDGQAQSIPTGMPVAAVEGMAAGADKDFWAGWSPRPLSEHTEGVSFDTDPVRELADRLWAAAGNR